MASEQWLTAKSYNNVEVSDWGRVRYKNQTTCIKPYLIKGIRYISIGKIRMQVRNLVMDTFGKREYSKRVLSTNGSDWFCFLYHGDYECRIRAKEEELYAEC